jgi:hypothetical protein
MFSSKSLSRNEATKMAVHALCAVLSTLACIAVAADLSLADLKQQSQAFVATEDARWETTKTVDGITLYPLIALHCLEGVDPLDATVSLKRLKLCHQLGARSIMEVVQLANTYVATNQPAEAIEVLSKVRREFGLTFIVASQL